MEVYNDPLNQEVAYAQLGSFYLFVKKDLIKSLKFYTKAGGTNMDSYAMKVGIVCLSLTNAIIFYFWSAKNVGGLLSLLVW